VPENGDALVFPVGGSNTATNNNISSLQVTSITFNGTGYMISGNSLTVTSVQGITANESATITADVNYSTGSHVNFYPAAGKTLTLGGATNLNVTGFYETNIGSSSYSGTVDFTGNITGTSTGQFIAVNGAKAIVRGANNTFTSGAVGAESDGIFECRSLNCFGDTANSIYVGNGAVEFRTSGTYSNGFQTSALSAGNSWFRAYENVSITGNGSVNDPLGIDQTVAGKSLQFTGLVTLDQNVSTFGVDVTANIKFDGILSGTGGISIGSGTTWLDANNTYGGVTTINNGAVVQLGHSAGLGNTSSGTTVLSGGALYLPATVAGTSIIAEPLTISGAGNATHAAAIYSDSTNNQTFSGNITLDGGATVRHTSLTENMSFDNIISGTGDLTLYGQYDGGGSASWSLAGGAPNTYSGKTIVAGGTVYFEKEGAIPHDLDVVSTDPVGNRSSAYFYNSSDVMGDTAALTIGSGEDDDITFGENDEVIGSLQGGGVVHIQTSGDRLIIDQDSNTTYDGIFYTDGNPAVVEKKGTGTLQLNGDAGFMGDVITFVATEGTLVINGNVKTTTGGNVSVVGGTLKGVGTVGGITSLGGKIAPGNSPGILHVNSLALNSSTTFEVEIAGATAGTEYDQTLATGAVDLGGAVLQLLPTYTPTAGQVFTIISGASVAGTFNGLADGAEVVANGITFRINYTATTVTLTYISGIAGAPNTGLAKKDMAVFGLAIVAGAGLLVGRFAARRRSTSKRREHAAV
jgi:autotransporter-associated beta strand protein